MVWVGDGADARDGDGGGDERCERDLFLDGG